jgi:sugar phosphate permease
MTAMTFAIGGMSYWMPDYLQERLKNNHTWAGNAYSARAFFGALIAVAGLTATLLGGMVADKARNYIRGAYFVISGAGILLSVVFLVLMLCSPFPLAWLWIFLAVFCLFFNTGPSNTILANVTHPSIRASAFAVNIFIIHLFGDVPSPPLLGFLSDHFNSWTPSFVVVCIFTFMGGIFWLWGSLYLDHDTERVLQSLPAPAADA